MRFLLRPGWMAFIVVVIGFSVACYTVLAPWQFRRNAEREAQNRAIAASFAHPPVPLTELVPSGTAPSPEVEWRQAVVRGTYLPDADAVVRLRSVQGRPAFEVLAVFRTETGQLVAVDRGYVRPTRGRQVADYPPPPPGVVELTGRIRLDETDPQHRPPLRTEGQTQLYAADSRQLGQVTGQELSGGYLQLVADQPGGLEPLPLPETDSGPFLSYAWQWLTFGAMALFGLAYFIRLEILHRRDRQAKMAPAEMARSETATSERGDETEPQSGAQPKPDRLAERYGKARF